MSLFGYYLSGARATCAPNKQIKTQRTFLPGGMNSPLRQEKQEVCGQWFGFSAAAGGAGGGGGAVGGGGGGEWHTRCGIPQL